LGTQWKREGDIGVVEQMIANALRKPMKVWLHRLNLASYMPVHDGSATINAVPTIM
jgi:hypothetical protein